MKNSAFQDNDLAFEAEALLAESNIVQKFSENCGPCSFMGSEARELQTHNTLVFGNRF